MATVQDKVATRAQTGIQAHPDASQTVANMIAENWKLFASTIPKHVTPERLTRIAINTIRTNAKLQQCSVASLVGAVMQCARFGFEPNTTGECYIIPYNNEASFQLGYIGHVQLLHRSGMVASVGAIEVCENDTKTLGYGPESAPSIVKAEGDRGEVVGYFAWVSLRTGGYMWEYMTKAEIIKHRDKFSKSYAAAKKYNREAKETWVTSFDSMAKKTVLLRVMKYAPKSVEINAALFADEKITRDPFKLDEVSAVEIPDEMMTKDEALDESKATDEQAATADAALNFGE